MRRANQSKTDEITSFQIQRSLTSRFRYLKFGFHLLIVFWLLNAFYPVQGLSIEKVLISSILLLSVLCFVLQIITNPVNISVVKFDFFSKLLLIFFLFWCIVTIIRGFEYDASKLFTLLANPEVGGLVWLLPFAIYIGRQPGALQALLPVFRLHALIGIVLVLLTIIQVGFLGVLPKESYTKIGLIMLYAAPLVLLAGLGSYLDRITYLNGLAFSTVAHFLLANRMGFATSFMTLCLVMVLGHARNIDRIIFRTVLFSLALTTVVILSADFLFTNLNEDWFTDTRTFLWEEMNDDFSMNDWLVGRGALGSYYSPYFDFTNRHGLEGDWMYRQVNEIGYLHIALKAGLIGVFLYFLIFVRAIFKSFNLVERRLAVGLMVLLIMHIFEMFVVGQASFQPARVLLWLLVGVALAAPLKHRRKN